MNMDILNSGSFVPLDNRERIEQLIFTAKTLATEVNRTEGFQSSGPTNHQLGLEMWKGAEYMCRAHEEATIRNLFLSKFLETLREIERQTIVPPKQVPTQIVESPSVYRPDQVPHSAATTSSLVITDERPQESGHDEYLGVIPSDAEIATERRSYMDECVPEFEADIVAMSNGAGATEIVGTRSEELPGDEPSLLSEVPEPEELMATSDAKPDFAEIEESDPVRECEGEGVSSETSTPDQAATIDSIVLTEKEPYNFDSCTVTAVMQLLPGNDGIRKCVVSVRSHDFIPQISISDLTVSHFNADANRLFTEAIGRYRMELPVLAAEKIKKVKPASKKRTAKTNDKDTKPNSAAETGSITPPATQNSEAAKDQRNLFAS